MIASFNYSHSDGAVMIGFIVAMGVTVALVRAASPFVAASVGAFSWAFIAYAVGLAGRGDMTSMMAILYAVLAFPMGAIVCGVGAWIRSRTQPPEPPGKASQS